MIETLVPFLVPSLVILSVWILNRCARHGVTPRTAWPKALPPPNPNLTQKGHIS